MCKILKLKLALALIITSKVLITPLQSQPFSDKEILLKPTDYKLSLNVDYDNKKLIGDCQLTIFNPSGHPIQTIPLLVYRLMKVKTIKDENKKNIPFTQRVLSFEDWEVLQVNYIEVSLEEPIAEKAEKKITIEYEGYLLGYTETGMLYVKDRIDPEFTIIRPDCRAYPMIGVPSWRVNRIAGLPKFDYLINVTVPDSLVVANGGRLLDKRAIAGSVTYIYQSVKPAWRIDIAIAKYHILEDEKNKVFYFVEDSVRASKIMEAIKNNLNLYTDWFGPLHDYKGFTFIEILDGWGSQSSETTIIQTAAAFKDDKKLHELYHEISHQWNVTSNDTFPPRLEEGLATFLEYLSVEKLEQRKIIARVTDSFCNRLREQLQKNPQYTKIPLIDFGKEGVTDLSYSVGMLVFHVLYKLVGEHEFSKIIGSFYQKYYETGAMTDEFVNHAKQISSINLTNFFEEWVYTAKYTEYIISGLSMEEITRKYQ